MDINKLKKDMNKYKHINRIGLYKKGRIVKTNSNYTYILKENYGRNIDIRLKNALRPSDMLNRGIFSGKYINDDVNEYPYKWYKDALLRGKLSPEKGNPYINEFQIKSRLSLKYWKKKGWIYGNDNKGWFQWYCRYFIGRRDPIIDEIQIKRWLSFKRHAVQLHKAAKRHNRVGDKTFRSKQRQSLLQWAWDPYIDLKYLKIN